MLDKQSFYRKMYTISSLLSTCIYWNIRFFIAYFISPWHFSKLLSTNSSRIIATFLKMLQEYRLKILLGLLMHKWVVFVSMRRQKHIVKKRINRIPDISNACVSNQWYLPIHPQTLSIAAIAVFTTWARNNGMSVHLSWDGPLKLS